MTPALCYVGGGTAAAWGVAHLLPTPKIVAGFGGISDDNRNIITMEWIAEGAMLILIGAVVIVATAMGSSSRVAQGMYVVSSVALVGLAAVSLLTGFKIRSLPFRLCPVIFAASTVLILLGGFA